MANTFKITSQSYDGRYMYLTCNQAVDMANNKSIISWTLTVTGGTTNNYTTGPTTVYINNQKVYYAERVSWSTGTFPAKKGSVSGTIEVEHDTEGKKIIECSLSTAIYSSTVKTTSDTWELDNITRWARIIVATNFTDEENPQVFFSKAGAGTVDVYLIPNNTTNKLCYRADIPNTGIYTYNLTDEERNDLRTVCNEINSCDCKFVLKTTINGLEYETYVTKTLTIVNANPTLSPTIYDNNLITQELTGDNNKLIRFYSNAIVTTGGESLKSATITEQTITNGSNTIIGDNGIFENVESGTFKFSVTDSRNNKTTSEITKAFIEYEKLSCVVENNRPDVDGNFTFNVSGNYFNNTFGKELNTLNVRYRYKPSNGSYGEWAEMICQKNGNTYTAFANITGLDYRTTYIFEAEATDKLSTVQSAPKAIRVIPIFDYGENDFRFNVPVLFGSTELTEETLQRLIQLLN